MYSNRAYGEVTMSAANTLTFAAIQMAVGMFQGIAMLIHRINWRPAITTMREMIAATDSLQFAITSSNRLTSIVDVSEPAIIDQMHFIGIGANTALEKEPYVTDWSQLPGGGKLIPANPLFIAANSGGFGAAGTVRAEILFTFVSLADRDYLELIQGLFPSNI
jgi:hypothetical protein